jgi:hypothetical protein
MQWCASSTAASTASDSSHSVPPHWSQQRLGCRIDTTSIQSSLTSTAIVPTAIVPAEVAPWASGVALWAV